MEELTGKRLNHNNKQNTEALSEFFVCSIEQVAALHPKARFVFYGRPEPAAFSAMPHRLPYNISPALFDTCNDKERFRRIVRENGLSTLPDKILPGDALPMMVASACFSGARQLVAQDRVGFGGHQTFLLPRGAHQLDPQAHYLVSPFLEQSVPVNIHISVFAKGDALVFPGSVQLVEEVDGRLLYMGGDYGLYQGLTAAEREGCRQMALRCGAILQNLGYRGVAGIDLLLNAGGDPIFLELNPRFQSSTAALNHALARSGRPMVLDAHLEAFRTDRCQFSSDVPPVNESFFAPLLFGDEAVLDLPDGDMSYDVDDARSSAFSPCGMAAHVFGPTAYPLTERESGSTLARIHFPDSIAAIDTGRRVRVQPAIQGFGRHKTEFANLRRDQVS